MAFGSLMVAKNGHNKQFVTINEWDRSTVKIIGRAHALGVGISLARPAEETLTVVRCRTYEQKHISPINKVLLNTINRYPLRFI